MSRPIKNDFFFRDEPDISVNGDVCNYMMRVRLTGKTTDGKMLTVGMSVRVDAAACFMRQCRRELARISNEMTRQVASAETVLPTT